MSRYMFLNSPAPQTVFGPGVSDSLKCSDIYVQATADCFICISADGTGTDGNAVDATNGHFMGAGMGLPITGINAAYKLGVNTGTVYISTLG